VQDLGATLANPAPDLMIVPFPPSLEHTTMRPRLPQMLGCSLLCVPRMLVWIY